MGIEKDNHQFVISYYTNIVTEMGTCLTGNQCMGEGSCPKGRIAEDCVTRKNEAEEVVERTKNQITPDGVNAYLGWYSVLSTNNNSR